MKRVLAVAATMLIASGCGGGGSSTPVQDINVAPVISSIGALTVQEGSTEVATISASDANADALFYAISSGDDRALFEISSSGAVTFLSAPDYEVPGDAGGNNEYTFTVQVSDGSLKASQELTVSVSDAFEGRIVDGPIKGAAVFVDLDGNSIQDDGESSGVSDDNGFFKLPMFEIPAGATAKVISKGGTDTVTGKALDGLVMISDVPADITKPANVTPLTTVLAAAETAEAKAILLSAMGISGTAETLITTDVWATAMAGDADSKAIQRINQQLGLLLQTAGTVIGETGVTDDVSVSLAASLASQLSQAAVSESGLDLTSSGALQTVLRDAIAAVAPDAAIAAQTLTAVSQSLASVNRVMSDLTLDPMSDAAAEVVKATQQDLQTSVANVISGDLSVADFVTQADAAELLGSTLASAELLDTDGDGTPNLLDSDDDGDMVPDLDDAYPLISLGTNYDTDMDGRPDECDAACQVLGLSADTDDDGDGVLDYEDPFPLLGDVTRTKRIPAKISLLRVEQ